jgi:hypothetical protein
MTGSQLSREHPQCSSHYFMPRPAIRFSSKHFIFPTMEQSHLYWNLVRTTPILLKNCGVGEEIDKER